MQLRYIGQLFNAAEQMLAKPNLAKELLGTVMKKVYADKEIPEERTSSTPQNNVPMGGSTYRGGYIPAI